jgi:hypothetical protein
MLHFLQAQAALFMYVPNCERGFPVVLFRPNQPNLRIGLGPTF